MAKNRLDSNHESSATGSDLSSSAITNATFVSAYEMHYIINGRAGHIHVKNGIILHDDIIRGIIDLISEIHDIKSGKTRSKRNHETSQYVLCWP